MSGLTARGLGAGAAVVLGTVVLASAAPLLVYTTTLAVAGLPHVAAELRYVGRRFGPRLSRRIVQGLIVLLLGVAALRLVQILGIWVGTARLQAELWLVVLLALVALPTLLREGGLPLSLALGGVGLLVGGLLVDPSATILILACLHNWTPVAFVAEVTEGRARRQALLLCAVVFGAVPLLLLSGIPAAFLASQGLSLPDWTPLPAGPLAAHLGAYLPRPLHSETWARDAFTALVYAQCMHYAAVLHVLPALGTRAGLPPEPAAVRWTWRGGTLAITAALLVAFSLDFGNGRSAYGVFAAIHAWVEVPLLLLALAPASVLLPVKAKEKEAASLAG